MIKYKTILKSYLSKKKNHFNAMLQFGEKMRIAMGLSQQDLNPSDDMIWEIDGFALSVRSFPQNGWIPMIIVCPGSQDASSIGYTNTTATPPNNWYYDPKGTATVFYPPKEIQRIILGRIANSN